MKLTPKQRVLAAYQGAYTWACDGLWWIFPRRAYKREQNLGTGGTPRQAWADAARNL